MAAANNANERSWSIELISEINIMLLGLNLRIKHAGGERTLSADNKSMFPDVLLYGDEVQSRILQGWELKMPDVLITNEVFIKDAMRKALVLGLNSFVIWNFTFGKIYIKNDAGIFEEARTFTGTSHIKTRADVTTYKDQWIPIIKEMILEINEFMLRGTIKAAPLIDVLSDNLMTAVIHRNKELVANNYRAAAYSNMIMERRLKAWWSLFQKDYVNDEPDLFTAYSKTVLLNWINRVMFANAIKRYHNCAAIIETINVTSTPEDGNSIFKKIIEEGDYFNVFKGIEFNDMIPTETWIDIVDFNRFLIDNGISDIDQTVLQNLLEKTVSTAKREIRGQYTTPQWLADILCQITINDWTGVCADICSGTGTIAKAIITNKNNRVHDIERTLGTTWASDKYAYPLQVSNIALTSFESINIPVNLFQADAFELSPGKDIVIKNPADGCDIHLQYPVLDAVVSNLPFVKANLIAKDEKEHIADIRKEIKDKTGIVISGKADLYIYFPFKIHQLLCDGGRLGIILSNSWLGTETGKDFFRALSFYYNFREIVLSNCGRWFDNAKVIATLVVLEKKCITQPDLAKKINFCLVEKDLKTISNDQKENIITDIVLQEERDSKLVQIKSYSMQEIMDIQDKGISMNAFFHNIFWVNKIADKLVSISDIFTIKRGERRGWNALFYPYEKHGIEGVYIKKVLKAPGKLTGYRAKTDIEAFCCNKSMEELQQLGHCGAINWIRKFATITNGTGKLLPIALEKAGSYWYEMDDTTKADMVTALNPNKRLF